MIQAKVHDQDDNEFASLWLREVPHVGELLWFAGEDGPRMQRERGTSSFKVKTVAHWVSTAWSPGTHVGEPIHTVCLYVEPVGS